MLDQIRENRATIIFVNSRGLCERLTQRLNELAEEEVVRSHHGSVSHEKRKEIEEGLKRGLIKGIVATSSLELGIDMGAVDRVILVESPGSVSRGLQRVGRAGHQVGEQSVGRIFPKFRGDLLESTVIAQRMLAGEIESIRVPQNALDVLAQQIVAICCDAPRTVASIEALIHRAYPYHQTSSDAVQALLEMLSGHYPLQDFADLRPLLAWDRAGDELRPRRGSAMVSRMNAGTIPDRGNYLVTLGPQGSRLGELDEEMVFETRPGETILLGATSWRVEEITRDRVIVSPAPGEPGKLPFWRGDGPGRPIELGRALGAFLRRLGNMTESNAKEWLQSNARLDSNAATNLANYIGEQNRHDGGLPTDRSITVERFRDELGDWRLCILSPFGSRVHAPWSMALQRLLSMRSGFEVQVMYTDDGIVLRFADTDELPELEALLPDPDEVEELVTDQLAQTAMFAGLFRENAARSLLLPRRRVDQRSPLRAQRLKSQDLLAAVRKYANFPMVLETYRQALSDIFDIAALRGLLRDIQTRKVRIHEVETPSASPFARSLVFAYVAAYIYEQDAPLAERRAQALTLDRNLLGELLGQSELRELIDADVLAQVEAELQRLTEERRARDADEIHDLLRHLGDLSAEEIALRARFSALEAVRQLAAERRAIEVSIAGDKRWIAAENAASQAAHAGTIARRSGACSCRDGTSWAASAKAYRDCARSCVNWKVGGRWSLVAGLHNAEISDTERTVARANLLLDRYGIVSREMVSVEGIPGGFGPIYKVLSAFEEAGRVRRGYFIEGLSGAQFARPGTVDRLRGVCPPDDPDLDLDGEQRDMVFLPAIDPANPWGSLLPWPETGDRRPETGDRRPETGDPGSGRRPRRVAGAWLLLCHGRPLLYVGAKGRQLMTFPGYLTRPGIAKGAFEALHGLPKSLRRGTLIIEKIDGQPIAESEYYQLILSCGFVRDYRGVAAEAFP